MEYPRVNIPKKTHAIQQVWNMIYLSGEYDPPLAGITQFVGEINQANGERSIINGKFTMFTSFCFYFWGSGGLRWCFDMWVV